MINPQEIIVFSSSSILNFYRQQQLKYYLPWIPTSIEYFCSEECSIEVVEGPALTKFDSGGAEARFFCAPRQIPGLAM